MYKKVILMILTVILIIMLGGIYIFSEDKKNEEQLQQTSNQENINTEDETRIENTENSMATDGNINSFENNNLQAENHTEQIIVNQVSPSGFMGSSLYQVILYSDGEVYVKKYDGNGKEDNNVISSDLVARNVQSIEAAKEDEHLGEVWIKGGEIINRSFGWINFE